MKKRSEYFVGTVKINRDRGYRRIRQSNDPVAILSRSGGQRGTDSFEVFPCPERNEDGQYQFHFLVHGLSHMAADAVERAERLVPGETLLVMKDIQNSQDARALALRTSERFQGDMYLVGSHRAWHP